MQVFQRWHHKILGHAAKSVWVEKKGGVLDSYKHLCFCSQGRKKEQTFPMMLQECKCCMSILANSRNGISCAVFTAQLSCPSYISCVLSTGAYAQKTSWRTLQVIYHLLTISSRITHTHSCTEKSVQIFCIKALKLHPFTCKLNIFVSYIWWYLGCKTWKLAGTPLIFLRKESQKFLAIMLLFDRGRIVGLSSSLMKLNFS